MYDIETGDTLAFELPVEYHCKLLDMDAKEFGLPQTRTRNYMLIWRPELYPTGVDVAQMWTDLVDHLRCPLKFPIDSFLLSDESDRVHRFRDALQGPLGRLTALSKQSGDWWDQTTSASNKDTGKHVAFRSCEGADYKATNKNNLSSPADLLARPWTGWGPNSQLSLSCHDWWPEYLSVLAQRELDLIDCFGIVGALPWGSKGAIGPVALKRFHWPRGPRRLPLPPPRGVAAMPPPPSPHLQSHRLLATHTRINSRALAAAEVGLDPLHHSLWWNVSQNVGRTDVLSRPGITSCITPGGENFGPHRGRCILGYEKLLLSGIPADKLLLGTETEVQLSDLAGNAMAMPVISAAILAALCVPAYARAIDGDASFTLASMADSSASSKTSGGKSAAASKAGKAVNGKAAMGKAPTGKAPVGKAVAVASDGSLDEHLVALLPLCSEAEATSILCTSETCGGVSASPIVRCSDCLLSSSRSCGKDKEFKWHNDGAPAAHPCCHVVQNRKDLLPADFEQKLRSQAPTAISLDEPSVALLATLGVELPADGGRDFRLTRVLRERGGWMLGYSVCDTNLGTPLAELRVTIGRLAAGRGLSALLFSFAPALRGERGRMPPKARALIPADATPRAKKSAAPLVQWEVLREPQACKLRLAASSLVPSYRSEVGLVHYANETWPGELHISAESARGAGTSAGTAAAAECAGVYERLACRHSCAFGALWRRKTISGKPPRWLLVRPTLDRTAPDELVIASSPVYRDCDSHVVMELLPAGEPTVGAGVVNESDDDDEEEEAEEEAKPKKKRAKTAPKKAPKVAAGTDAAERATFKLLCELGKAVDGAGAPAAKKPKKGSSTSSGRGAEKLVAARAKVWEPAPIKFVVPRDATKLNVTVFGIELTNLPAATATKLIEAATTVSQLGGGVASASAARARGGDGWHELRVLTASSTIAERRLAEAVAAPLLRFAACGELKGGLSNWQTLKPAKGEPEWGLCAKSAPPRPAEVWTSDGQRTYDVKASNEFERALRARPSAWDVRIHTDGRLKVTARPDVAAHRAAEALCRGRGLDASGVQINWHVDTQRSTLVASPLTNFTIPTSEKWDAAKERPPFFKAEKALFPRQAKALTWMLAVDQGDVPFDETEYSDHTLSSGVGWTLNAKAVHTCPLRGGVVADAVGAGKTVNAIALIASTAHAARQAKAKADKKDLTHSAATLVIYPIHAVKTSLPVSTPSHHFASVLTRSHPFSQVIAPIHAVKPVWRQLLNEFTTGLKCEIIENVTDLKALSVAQVRSTISLPPPHHLPLPSHTPSPSSRCAPPTS